MAVKTPRNLYKYLAFNENTIESLTTHQAYYSDPAFFNDPLDCKPVVTNDVSFNVLENVVCELIRKRTQKELEQTAKKLKMKGGLPKERISILSYSEVSSFLQRVHYDSTEYNSLGDEKYKSQRYIETIQDEITNIFKRGVLCLSRKFDSPLMWSHYANNHRGICVEYDMIDVEDGKAKKIIYGGSRDLKISDIDGWLSKGVMSEDLMNVCLLTKSKEWSYESEWRLFGKIGLGGIEPTIKSIIFGLNCKDTTISSIINSLAHTRRGLKFWQIYNVGSGFKLSRRKIDLQEYQERYSNILSYGEVKRLLSDDDLS